MKGSGAMAGMASAAMLLAPGCGGGAGKAPASADEPLRRASFRSLAAREFLFSCPGGAARGETRAAIARHEELKQLALGKDAGHAVALGENDWAGLRRHDERGPCAPGDKAYFEALAAFRGALDTLAGRIADHRGAAP